MPNPSPEEHTATIHLAWKGRAALSNRESRFHRLRHEPDSAAGVESADPDDDAEAKGPATEVRIEIARSIVSSNRSPDIPFDRSINPYRGCEHGCVYCYARPSHAYLGLSPGLDFETKIFAKTNAPELLRKELQKNGAGPLIALGANTDPYQPVERRLQITRSLLQVMNEFDQPVGVTTKSSVVTRDIDILAPMAARGLAKVFISVATLDADIARTMEPRANSPARRIQAIEQLSRAGIPTGVFVAPVIPALTDKDLERVLEAASQAGARYAGYVMLRLPLELRDLFTEWLQTHYPLRASHVMGLVRQMRGGRDNDSTFGQRMRGTGPIADLLERRFRIACKRLGLNADRMARYADMDRSEKADGPIAPQRPDTAMKEASPQLTLFE
ncbi:MAG: PA0069 family radical SAM protein [Burkholderiaceae bacterium]|nr:PA0069 family radical SAM protein [Burkholderiaceae bacterium]